jgi:hypothetical protein
MKKVISQVFHLLSRAGTFLAAALVEIFFVNESQCFNTSSSDNVENKQEK